MGKLIHPKMNFEHFIFIGSANTRPLGVKRKSNQIKSLSLFYLAKTKKKIVRTIPVPSRHVQSTQLPQNMVSSSLHP